MKNLTKKCSDLHKDYANETCPRCNLPVDSYGNTEDDFQYCCFPDCGCDGARLCMAGEASEDALMGNVEGMWSNGSNKKCAEAVLYTMGLLNKRGGTNE